MAMSKDSLDELTAKYQKISASVPIKYYHGRQNINSSGDYMSHCKDVRRSFIVTEAQNCRYCMWLLVGPSKDCWDYIDYGDNSERVYETICTGLGASDVKFSVNCFENLSQIEYSMFCLNSQNLFGCVGLRKKQFCILNKQYSESEYLKLKEKIVGDMRASGEYGEFMPTKYSPLAYNESRAQEFFPLSQKEALMKGYRWQNTEKRNHQIGGDVLPCMHNQECVHNCPGAFKLTAVEKDFYTRFNLAIPKLCSNCRHYARADRKTPLKLWHRKCMKPGCSNEFQTSYSPDRPEIVYCEQCYQQEIV